MKRMLNLFAVLALSLTLGGCITNDLLNSSGKSLLQGGKSLTAPIVNPVQPVNIYQVKLVYDAAVDIANEYRDFCYAKPYAVLMDDPIAGPACKNRREVVRQLQSADDKAADAIDEAVSFIAANPKLSAVTVIRAAWAKVVSFQGAINTAAASSAPVQQ